MIDRTPGSIHVAPGLTDVTPGSIDMTPSAPGSTASQRASQSASLRQPVSQSASQLTSQPARQPTSVSRPASPASQSAPRDPGQAQARHQVKSILPSISSFVLACRPSFFLVSSFFSPRAHSDMYFFVFFDVSRHPVFRGCAGLRPSHLFAFLRSPIKMRSTHRHVRTINVSQTE